MFPRSRPSHRARVKTTRTCSSQTARIQEGAACTLRPVSQDALRLRLAAGIQRSPNSDANGYSNRNSDGGVFQCRAQRDSDCRTEGDANPHISAG